MTWAFPEVDSLWRRVVPFEYSGTFMLSAVLGFLLPPLINLFYRDVMVAERAAVETGDLIELLIAESIRRHILIEVSLKSGKAYIGYAIEAEPPVRGESDVAVVPLWSGYRHSETRELMITKVAGLSCSDSQVRNRISTPFRPRSVRPASVTSGVGALRAHTGPWQRD